MYNLTMINRTPIKKHSRKLFAVRATLMSADIEKVVRIKDSGLRKIVIDSL